MGAKIKKRLALGAYLFIVALLSLFVAELLGSWLGGGGALLAMAALTGDRLTPKKLVFKQKAYPVKTNVKIYAGALVGVDSAGFAIVASNAASVKVVGVALNQADNTGGADGAINVLVEEGLFQFNATSITQAMVGQMMYVVDDNTFDDAVGTAGVKAGRLLEFDTATLGWIWVQPSGVGAITANADATYGQPEADLINELKTIVNSWL